ncbi:TetR/AcrR family transcriptional regulator [Streptomyces sp. NBC_01217]|uniref:TetR/AcrR family transcriptional regulator n=1 Tax=Streptomyces sp. NBC_01217 TaxID=2903779 RepID=UPI002E158561|nr:TetR/AcrR family transcriptional regulator [Streptomyces sp. NBC_01217]
MTSSKRRSTGREEELIEAAYRHVAERGISRLSLRPLAESIGSSPGVLIFLFGSKDGVIRAILARARRDELAMLAQLRENARDATLIDVARALWAWLSAPGHRPVLRLWVESYGQSLVDTEGPWAGFAQATVNDWLGILSDLPTDVQPEAVDAPARCSAVLAALRGCLIDLLATGDEERIEQTVELLFTRIDSPASDRPR